MRIPERLKNDLILFFIFAPVILMLAFGVGMLLMLFNAGDR